MAWKLHAIEQTQLRRQHRVDGVGRPKFDSHRSGEHLDKGFIHSLLQTCSCADGADDGRDPVSYIVLHWEGEVDGLAPGDTPIKKYTSDPGG